MAEDVLSITEKVLGTTEDVLGVIEDVLGITKDVFGIPMNGPRPFVHPLLYRNLARRSMKTTAGGLETRTW